MKQNNIRLRMKSDIALGLDTMLKELQIIILGI